MPVSALDNVINDDAAKERNVRGENLPHPVELIFEKKESVDALIKQLKVMKKDMIKFEKGELKDEQGEQED